MRGLGGVAVAVVHVGLDLGSNGNIFLRDLFVGSFGIRHSNLGLGNGVGAYVVTGLLLLLLLLRGLGDLGVVRVRLGVERVELLRIDGELELLFRNGAARAVSEGLNIIFVDLLFDLITIFVEILQNAAAHRRAFNFDFLTYDIYLGTFSTGAGAALRLASTAGGGPIHFSDPIVDLTCCVVVISDGGSGGLKPKTAPNRKFRRLPRNIAKKISRCGEINKPCA